MKAHNQNRLLTLDWTITIRSKLFFIITLLIGFISLFIFFYFPERQKAQAIDAIRNKATSIAEMIAYTVGPGLYFDDREAIDDVFRSAHQNSDIVYIVAFNDNGQTFAEYSEAPALTNHTTPGGKNHHSRSDRIWDDAIYEIQKPIVFNGSAIGQLFLGLSLESARQDIERSQKTIGLISILIFLVGMGAVLAVSTVVTGPLSMISETARHIANGDFTQRAEIASRDEVGNLAKAFNIMVDNLEVSRKELEEINSRLEDRVQERTLKLEHEVVEHAKTEIELERSLSLLTATLESTADAILVVDNAGNIVSSNHKFQDIWQIPDEIIQSGDDDKALKFVTSQLKYPDQFLAKVMELYANPEMESQDILEFKDGRIFERFSQAQKIGDKCIGRVWSFRDITENKRLEENLRQAQKMEAVGKLAGGIAHDFNNILTIITGYCELLLMKLDIENDLRLKVLEISKAGERAAALTRQLLAFSRKQVLEPKMLNLNGVLVNLEKMLQRLIGEDIDLSLRLDQDLGLIKADPSQIEQVVMNLAVNARDAMPDGGKITVETANVYLDDTYCKNHSAIQPGAYTMLAVTDTGCGMTPEVRSRIFEPFFTTKGVGKGTGLGLAMVYGIIKQSGGHIWVYSEVDHGTSFKIYLPQVYNEQASPPREQSRHRQLHGDETILLVEDEPAVRDLTNSILLQNGYHVLTASNGKEALDISTVYGGTIQLVLTDVIMPQMNGKELADHITRQRPDVKVLFMSGYTDEAIIRLGVLDADRAYLQKPFTPLSLTRKIREVLSSDCDTVECSSEIENV